MSSANTPIEAAFELQRRSIEHGERLFEHGLELQRDATETMLRNGFTAQRRAQEEGVEMTRKLFDAQVDAVQSAIDGDEFQSMVDEQFESFGDEQSEAWEAFESEFFEAFEDLSEHQRELVAESVRTTLDAHEDVEHQAVEGAERTREVAETAQERTEEAARQTAEATERQVEVAGQQIASSAEQAASTGQRTGETDQQEAKAQSTATAPTVEEQLEDVEGLGPTYADRLRSQGIESLVDLAEADDEAVARTADVSEQQAGEWIETARSWI